MVKWSNRLYSNEMTFTLKSLGPLTATRKSLDVLSPRKIHSPFRFFYDTCFSDLVIRSFTAITFSQRCKKQRLHAFSTSHSYFFACLVIHSFRFCINLIPNQLFPLDFLLLMISDIEFQTNTFLQISWFSRTRGSGHLSPRDFVSDFGQIDKCFRRSNIS